MAYGHGMSVSSKSRWTIGELAKMVGISVRALRHYEDLGLLVPDRSEGGHRRYGASDFARLRQIIALRQLGLGLQHIAAWLDSSDPELLRELVWRRLHEVELRLAVEDRLRQRLEKLLGSLERSGDRSAKQLIEEMEERVMGIELTQIYTGLGDGGETQLANLQRVAKTDPRIEAGGALHELSAQLAFLLAEGKLPRRCRGWLDRIENDLFDLGSDLAWPADGDEQRPRVGPDYVAWLEETCDEINEPLEPLYGFVLPGLTRTAAQVEICSAVCRRAERRVFAIGDANPEIARYLNRLSDFFFLLGRTVSEGDERFWRPGGGRKEGDGDST
jgi:cob(I)alamin adenosyltransferase